MKKQLATYLIDISKLVFGGVVLSQILEISENSKLILIIGIMAGMAFAVVGFLILYYASKKERKELL